MRDARALRLAVPREAEREGAEGVENVLAAARPDGTGHERAVRLQRQPQRRAAALDDDRVDEREARRRETGRRERGAHPAEVVARKMSHHLVLDRWWSASAEYLITPSRTAEAAKYNRARAEIKIILQLVDIDATNVQ